ncbi:MAG: 50S ribosomal protein L10 [Fimbriimonadaceae bacterium]
MPTAEKANTIELARERYNRSVGVVFTDYRGLRVKEMQDLRAKLRQSGSEIQVIKNTLFRIAAGEDANSFTPELDNGPTAVVFVYEDEAAGAKAVVDYAKINKNFEVKGAFFSGKVLGQKEVENLAKLPPREVLLAQVLGAITAPLSNLVGVVEALYADPIRTIGAVADKVAEGFSLPVATEETAEAAAPEAPAEEEAVAPEVTAEADATEATEPATETNENDPTEGEQENATAEAAAEENPTETEANQE